MKLDRLLGIITILLQKDRVTAPELAEKFEVSRRTIGRDIDALCMAGIPVVAHQGAGGGLTIAEGFKLDKSVLTADELSGIIAALKGIGSVSEQSGIERVLDKLHANTDAVVSMREPVIIDLASYYGGQLTEKIELIKRAVFESRVIAFDYCYEKGESHRRIEPYFVIFQWSSWEETMQKKALVVSAFILTLSSSAVTDAAGGYLQSATRDGQAACRLNAIVG
jgi:predicted DNA-binding transcriptional regulator YafY